MLYICIARRALVTGVHWLVMTVWIVSQQTDFCDSKLQELIFDCIVGVIYCFSFFNLKEGKTRWRACVFYFVIFLENAALLSVWFLENQMDLLLKISLLIALFTAFVFGNYDLQQSFKVFHGYGILNYSILFNSCSSMPAGVLLLFVSSK